MLNPFWLEHLKFLVLVRKRFRDPSCSTLAKIPNHTGLFWPFQSILANTGRYVSFGQYEYIIYKEFKNACIEHPLPVRGAQWTTLNWVGSVHEEIEGERERDSEIRKGADPLELKKEEMKDEEE